MPVQLGEVPHLSVERIVSLVPSLTEAVAMTLPGRLVGVTDWCSHPADLDLPRVGGTKNPSVEGVLTLRPDIVLANSEENRANDIQALRDAGLQVHVTYPRTVPGALDELERMLTVLGAADVPWLRQAREVWAADAPALVARRAVIPVWRRPWVVVGSTTFAGDMLQRLGVRNAYGADPERYPRPTLAQLQAGAPDLVVLPDEPYAFSATDGPESFPGTRCALVSGRYLTWYGPSLVDARDVLTRQLSAARTYG